MMPQLLTVRVDRRHRRPVRLWIPVLPVALILAPLLLLAVLGGIIACLIFRISVPRTLGTGWRVFSALPGTRVDIEDGNTAVLVSIR
ncbi:hypothetical protein AB0J72_12255 [Dactylosporangium sp. NPDC049742]|uniref:hypothetical protein n=1 Tax=Dactylosporangium sp. NPDC049742 TaxID=3154737 RepID=UPI00343F8BFD